MSLEQAIQSDYHGRLEITGEANMPSVAAGIAALFFSCYHILGRPEQGSLDLRIRENADRIAG